VNRLRLLVMILWLGVQLSAFPSIVLAGDVEAIAADLRPVSGYLVMPLDDEFLIDLDARQGLRIGDLLSVVVPGEKVVHPITKEVIGSLDKVKAVLKVTRVKSGYSHARRISGSEALTKGEQIRRFAGLTAALYTSQLQGESFYDRLREQLPELEWQGRFQASQDSKKDSKVDLRFVLDSRTLRLLDRNGEQLRSYAITEVTGSQSAVSAVNQPVTAVTMAVGGAVLNAKPGTAAVIQPEAPGLVDFGRHDNLDAFPERVLMASFHKTQDRLLVATVAGSWVRVYEVADRLRPVGAVQVRSGTASALAVNWWQPDQAGPLYLAVTATVVIESNYGNIRETRMDGAIFEWDGNNLSPVATRAPYFLESFDRNGDGRPETLLGQEFDRQQVYGRVFELTLENQDLRKTKPSFPLPQRFALPGSTMADLDGDGQPEFIAVYNSELTIYSGSKKVYQSSGQMGGSLASMTYDINPGVTDTLFETVSLEIQPVVRDIDSDGVPELLAVASDSSSLKVPGIGPGINSSWVVVFKYRNGMYDKGRLKFERENPLQGLWVDSGQLYLVESKTTSYIKQEGASNLLVYPLVPGNQ